MPKIKKILLVIALVAISVYQFGYKVSPAKAVYPTMGSLDSANNNSDGTANSSANPASDPGITVYGTWYSFNPNPNFTSGGIYVDGLFVQSYYPGWFQGALQFGVDDTSLANGTHNVQLRGVDPVNGEYRTNALTFYVQHIKCTINFTGLVNARVGLTGTNNWTVSGAASYSGSYPATSSVILPGNSNYNFSVTTAKPSNQLVDGVSAPSSYITTNDSQTCSSSNSQTITFSIPASTDPQLQLR
ncbi:MAG: hypothetical protein NVSMB66_6010 [Candidatus Doudnabacteria bacterium]